MTRLPDGFQRQARTPGDPPGYELPASVRISAVVEHGDRTSVEVAYDPRAEQRRAGVNIIVHARLRLPPLRVTQDLPGGGKRFDQDVDGFVLTLVDGVPTHREGEATGSLPGRFVRLQNGSGTRFPNP